MTPQVAAKAAAVVQSANASKAAADVVARIASGELSFEDLSAAMKAFQGPPKGTALKLSAKHPVTAESVAMLMSGRVSIPELFEALKTLGSLSGS